MTSPVRHPRNSTPAGPFGRRPPATIMADAVMELRPSPTGGSAARDGQPWPIFAIVVDEEAAHNDAGVRRLFALLERGPDASRIAVVGGRYRVSAANPQRDLLRVAVRVVTPVRCEVDILLRTRPLRAVLHRLRNNPTLAITSRARANTFSDQIQTGDALQHLVLLSRVPASVDNG